MSHNHYTILCEICGVGIGGCRCMAPGRTYRKEGLCADCKAKAVTRPAPVVDAAPGLDLDTALQFADDRTHSNIPRDRALNVLAGEVRRLRAPGLEWTREKPTREGFYWVRPLRDPGAYSIEEVARIDGVLKITDLYASEPRFNNWKWMSAPDGREWAGPIPEPGDGK